EALYRIKSDSLVGADGRSVVVIDVETHDRCKAECVIHHSCHRGCGTALTAGCRIDPDPLNLHRSTCDDPEICFKHNALGTQVNHGVAFCNELTHPESITGRTVGKRRVAKFFGKHGHRGW